MLSLSRPRHPVSSEGRHLRLEAVGTLTSQVEAKAFRCVMCLTPEATRSHKDRKRQQNAAGAQHQTKPRAPELSGRRPPNVRSSGSYRFLAGNPKQPRPRGFLELCDRGIGMALSSALQLDVFGWGAASFAEKSLLVLSKARRRRMDVRAVRPAGWIRTKA